MMKDDYFNADFNLNSINFKNLTKNPNILIAAGFWDEERANAARICYKFMRKIDDLVDDHKVQHKTFNNCEKQAYTEQINEWIECLTNKSTHNPFLEEVAETITRFRIPVYLFHNFSRSMIYDINNDGFPTFNSFLNYAEGASVAPAAIFVHLGCLYDDYSAYRVPFMDLLGYARPCALFSYIVHIIRDFQKDMHENLNYFASDILAENNLSPVILKEIANGKPIPIGFRNMIKIYSDYAAIYKKEIETIINKLSDWLPVNYLLSFIVVYNLYLDIYNKIDIEKGNFNSEELNPSIDEIKRLVFEIVDKNTVIESKQNPYL